MRKSVETNIVTSQFNLVLPAVFDVKPSYVVTLPASCRALVYKTKVNNPDRDAHSGKGKQPPMRVDGWRVIIVNRNGRTPRALQSVGYRYHGDANDFKHHNPLDVRRHIEMCSHMLSKVKKVVAEETDALGDD